MLLVLLWRETAVIEPRAGASASATQFLQRFRQSLEIHFRDRWGVNAYAQELGMSSDRLHDICTRTLGKTPLRLIHERSVFEAQALLQRSSQTVDQIAAHLGFESAGQFNRFFKGIVGSPPGQYRTDSRHMNEVSSPRSRSSFADWP